MFCIPGAHSSCFADKNDPAGSGGGGETGDARGKGNDRSGDVPELVGADEPMHPRRGRPQAGTQPVHGNGEHTGQDTGRAVSVRRTSCFQLSDMHSDALNGQWGTGRRCERCGKFKEGEVWKKQSRRLERAAGQMR